MRKTQKTQRRALSRPLSAAERAIAKSVFGDDLNLDSVRIKSAFWVLKGYAVAPNGCVYFHRDDWREDFGDASLAARAWLVHELLHVWQFQKGAAVFWRALLDRRYRYRLKKDKPFWRYGIEQQAKIVEDFYKRRELGKDRRAIAALLPFLPDSV